MDNVTLHACPKCYVPYQNGHIGVITLTPDGKVLCDKCLTEFNHNHKTTKLEPVEVDHG